MMTTLLINGAGCVECPLNVAGFSRTGHYIADIYDVVTQDWFTCDDRNVARVTEEFIRTERTVLRVATSSSMRPSISAHLLYQLVY